VRHEFELYFWIRLSGLAGNVDVKGLDKVFPESRKLGDGATKVTGLGRMGQNLYHRGHRGSRGGSVVTPFPCLAKAARHGARGSRSVLTLAGNLNYGIAPWRCFADGTRDLGQCWAYKTPSISA